MIKIKVIDLLTKIANGEIEENIKYKFSQSDYCSVREFFNRYIMDRENLNIEVETSEDKKIEKIDYYDHLGVDLSQAVCNKINEIIDKINKE